MMMNDIAKFVRLSNSMTINDVVELTNLKHWMIARVESKERKISETMIDVYNQLFDINIVKLYDELKDCRNFKLAFLRVLEVTNDGDEITCVNDMLKLVRIANNLKIKELALILGISQYYISDIENGKRVVGEKTLFRYNSAFELNVDELYQEVVDKEYSFKEAFTLILNELNKEKITC